LETVAPEHLPIAQQVLRGGLPAVRQALAAETEKAKAEGRPPVSTGPILAIAEDLLPRLKSAEWRDRAEAAAAMGDEIGIRDLRSVVAGSEAAARDDETRLLASGLREALHRRVEAQRTSWVTDITTAMEESKFMRALRLTGRPPDPGVRLPADVAVKLAEAAGMAMTADLPTERWADLLEAVVGSPVRRSVKPVALPSPASPELLAAARQAAGQVPALAPLLGLARPPAPVAMPPRSLTARPARPPRGPRPVPPPPSVPVAEAPVEPASVPTPAAPVEPASVIQVEAAAASSPEAIETASEARLSTISGTVSDAYVAPEASHVAPEAPAGAEEASPVAPEASHVAPEAPAGAEEASPVAPEASHVAPEAPAGAEEASPVAPEAPATQEAEPEGVGGANGTAADPAE